MAEVQSMSMWGFATRNFDFATKFQIYFQFDIRKVRKIRKLQKSVIIIIFHTLSGNQ